MNFSDEEDRGSERSRIKEKAERDSGVRSSRDSGMKMERDLGRTSVLLNETDEYISVLQEELASLYDVIKPIVGPDLTTDRNGSEGADDVPEMSPISHRVSNQVDRLRGMTQQVRSIRDRVEI